MIVLACFCTFGMGGVVFGISSLYPVLYEQGFWRGLCNEAGRASLSTFSFQKGFGEPRARHGADHAEPALRGMRV